MKNIHLLDTDKPSRLFYLASNLHLEQGQLISPKNYQNIYITSDEEIKMGDWYIIEFNGTQITKCTSEQELISIEGRNDCQKIILTTDPVLISNGVQAIDDDFLEWFIKNPSCEDIKIEKQIGCIDLDAVCDFGEGYCPNTPDCLKNKYKIIIPKEEPKQEKWDKLNEELDDALESTFGTSPSNILDVFENAKSTLRKHLFDNKAKVARDLEQMREWSNTNKQETLEEAAENWVRKPIIGTKRESFIEGTKWQQERMYSEEEVVQLLIKFNQEIQEVEDVKGWFEEFKKN